MNVTCDHCGKAFEKAEREIRCTIHNFCSRECFRIHRSVFRPCSQCGKMVRRRHSYTLLYRDAFCSVECHAAWKKENVTGANNPNWRGGTSEPARRERANAYGSREKEWAQAVKAAAGNVCVKCGSTRRLIAHHIVGWDDDPDKRYLLSNGICLCSACHIAAHIAAGWFRENHPCGDGNSRRNSLRKPANAVERGLTR
jgi:hypothetical protein